MRSALAAVAVIGALASVGQATAPRGSDQALGGTAARPRTEKVRIKGRVRNAETRQPVSRVRMLLLTAEGRPIAVTTTDSAGRYELSSMTAGSYRVAADRDGFLPRRCGARDPGDIGTALTLRPGQVVEGADIALSPSCAISGRVVDASGEPVSHVYVIAGLRYRRADLIERFAAIRMAFTDDLGRYRLWGLPPGQYYVRAETMPPHVNREDPPGVDYAATYYPGTSTLSGARQIELTTDRREQTAEMVLPPKVRAARVSGTVVDASGRLPATNVYLSIRSTECDEYVREDGILLRADGSFTTPGLPPGEYTLSAAVADPKDLPPRGQWLGWGETRATVTGKDLGGVVVQLHPAATLSGRVVSESSSTPPVGTIGIVAEPVDVPWLNVSEGSVAKDGTFVVTALYGDRYFHVRGVPQGLMPKALIVNGRDVLNTPMAFHDGETIAGARLILAGGVSSVSVAAQDDDGLPPAHEYQAAYVALYRERSGHAPERVRWFGRAGRAPATFAGLPAGDYFAFASTTAAAFGDFDNDALGVLKAIGMRFSVRDGETKAITVTMIPHWKR